MCPLVVCRLHAPSSCGLPALPCAQALGGFVGLCPARRIGFSVAPAVLAGVLHVCCSGCWCYCSSVQGLPPCVQFAVSAPGSLLLTVSSADPVVRLASLVVYRWLAGVQSVLQSRIWLHWLNVWNSKAPVSLPSSRAPSSPATFQRSPDPAPEAPGTPMGRTSPP
jgi:hypothetical protein